MTAETYLAIFAFVAYILTVVGYILRAFEGIPRWTIFLGMCIVTVGYSILLYSKWLSVQDKEKHKLHTTKLNKIGYAVLFTFFMGIYIFPALTFTVRYYDIIAAVGYFAGAVSKYIPVVVSYGCLALYYVLGAYQKTKEEHWVDKLQLVSRTMLSIFYISTIIKVLA